MRHLISGTAKKLLILLTIVLPIVASSQNEPPSLPQDGKWVSNDHYLAPNEFNGDTYRPLLENVRGALIGVGTFRVLERAIDAMEVGGKFDLIVKLDYDTAAAQFNRLHDDLLREMRDLKKDRHEYLMALLGSEGNFDLLKKLKSGRISSRNYFIALTKGSSLGDCAICTPASRNLRNFLVKNRQGENLFHNLLLHLRDVQNKYFEESIFGSDARFKRALEIAAKTPTIVLAGNIAGGKTFPALADYLWKTKIDVSVVDVSNAPEYFNDFNYPKLGKLFDPFGQNLARLPLTRDALLLFTIEPQPGLGTSEFDKKLKNKFSAKDGWIYAAAPASDIIPRFGTEIRGQQDLYKYVEDNIVVVTDRSGPPTIPLRCKNVFRRAP